MRPGTLHLLHPLGPLVLRGRPCPPLPTPLHHLSQRPVPLAVWAVHEQVAVAALDAHALPFAASVIRAVNRRFPDSIRARRLQVGYRGVCALVCSMCVRVGVWRLRGKAIGASPTACARAEKLRVGQGRGVALTRSMCVRWRTRGAHSELGGGSVSVVPADTPRGTA